MPDLRPLRGGVRPIRRLFSVTSTRCGGGSTLYLGGLACGAALTLATPLALVALALLFPTLLATLADNMFGKPRARCVAMLGVAASIRPVVAAWAIPGGVASALGAVMDLRSVAVAWGAQAFGWLLAETIPLIARIAMDGQTAARVRDLREARARLEEEWSLPPRAEP